MMSGEIKKTYMRAMLPAFLGSIGMGIYYFTDGLFIGNALGDDGMSAISVSWAIVIFLTAVATGIGLGGSIRYSVALGKGDEGEAKDCFFTTVLLLLIASLVLTAFFLLFFEEVLRFLGASGHVYVLSREYAILVVYGILFQVMGIGAIPLVRNMGGHVLASVAMGAGYLLNFALDYILMFVYPLGMLGCSIAYISGQIVIAIPCVLFLGMQYRKRFRRERIGQREFFKTTGRIAASALSPFGLFFSQNIVLMFTNKAFITNGGSEALACYTVVVYVAGITNTLHRAIMDGSQPLISRFFGQGDHAASDKITKMMYAYSFALIAAGAVATFLLKYKVASLFGVSGAVSQEVAERLPLYIFAYMFICFSRTTLTYLYATERNKSAGILTYAEPVLFLALLLILPGPFGINGIWATVTAVYFLMAGLAAILLLRKESGGTIGFRANPDTD